MADEECSESIDSLDKSCNELKHAYDACFNLWFTEKFLKKDSKDPIANPCAAMLKEYSKCVKMAMKAKNMDPDAYAKHWEDAAKGNAQEESG